MLRPRGGESDPRYRISLLPRGEDAVTPTLTARKRPVIPRLFAKKSTRGVNLQTAIVSTLRGREDRRGVDPQTAAGKHTTGGGNCRSGGKHIIHHNHS